MTLNSEGLEKAVERKWTKWSERRPPNASGAFRFRCHCEVLGLLLTPEWTEKMTLCGMGYGEAEWWPLSSCYWDGYRRYITHAGLEWSEVHADDPDDVVWGGLDLSQCPFTGEAAKIKAHGRYIGAPIWHTEAMSVGSSAVPFRRFTDAKKLVEFWNRRALPPVDGLEVVATAWKYMGEPSVAFVVALDKHGIEYGHITDIQPLITLSQASSVIAGLRAEIADLRDEWQAEYDARIEANTARRLTDKRISSLEEQNKRLREALNQSRLAFSGYVSPRSAIDMIDALGDHND